MPIEQTFDVQVPCYVADADGRQRANGQFESRKLLLKIDADAIAAMLSRRCARSRHGKAIQMGGAISAKFIAKR